MRPLRKLMRGLGDWERWVTQYFAKDGYATRFWAIYLNGELLAVTVYRKGAMKAN